MVGGQRSRGRSPGCPGRGLGGQVFDLAADVSTLAVNVSSLTANVSNCGPEVSTLAANVFSFWPKVFSFGVEVFRARRGRLQFGDRRSFDRRAPRRHARSGPLRCWHTPSRPASRAGHVRSSFAVFVQRSGGLKRCRASRPIRTPYARPCLIDSGAECSNLKLAQTCVS